MKLFDDEEMYLSLILAIDQYISDEKEKRKLIEVLTMDMQADEIYEKVMNSGIYEQGLEQGLKEGVIRIAKNMKELGDNILDISKRTGLSIEEIESL